ncbi:MAG: hypothetical protein ACREDM_04660 [Methylocella sp.]
MRDTATLAGWITDKDFELAKKIEDIVLWLARPLKRHASIPPHNIAAAGLTWRDACC